MGDGCAAGFGNSKAPEQSNSRTMKTEKAMEVPGISIVCGSRTRCHFQPILGCALAVAISGCATVYEDRYAFNEGWRKARVEEVGLASELRLTASTGCRSSVPPEQLMHRNFARLSYSNVGHRRTRIVPVPTGVTLTPGDAVYLKIGSCSNEAIVRATPPR